MLEYEISNKIVDLIEEHNKNAKKLLEDIEKEYGVEHKEKALAMLLEDAAGNWLRMTDGATISDFLEIMDAANRDIACINR